MEQIRFTIPEILSLFGVAQCLYIIIYMIFRSGRISRAGLPLAYFSVLAAAFLLDAAQQRLDGVTAYYFYLQWAAWFWGPPLSVLLVVQIVQINRMPDLRHYWVLFLPAAAFLLAAGVAHGIKGCEGFAACEDIRKFLGLGGLVAGAVSLLSLWFKRDMMDGIDDKKTGKERYWLALAIIIANTAFLAATLVSLGVAVEPEKMVLIRTVLGLGFVYLVNTSLFRIYPQAVLVGVVPKTGELSAEEKVIAKKIELLLNQDKVYQEATYARTDLARECGTSEGVVSKVINAHFGKSFPQIINECRVADAKRLLGETEENIKIVAEEVGFNSVASFNRVFRDVAGETPSAYRKKVKMS